MSTKASLDHQALQRINHYIQYDLNIKKPHQRSIMEAISVHGEWTLTRLLALRKEMARKFIHQRKADVLHLAKRFYLIFYADFCFLVSAGQILVQQAQPIYTNMVKRSDYF